MTEMIAAAEEIPKLERISEDESSDKADQSTKKVITQYVPIKNRLVYDMHPKSADIYQSEWPKFWLKAVESRFKLRKAEAAKNLDFQNAMVHMLNEAIRVSME